jgi:hypothetical protein
MIPFSPEIALRLLNVGCHPVTFGHVPHEEHNCWAIPLSHVGTLLFWKRLLAFDVCGCECSTSHCIAKLVLFHNSK